MPENHKRRELACIGMLQKTELVAREAERSGGRDEIGMKVQRIALFLDTNRSCPSQAHLTKSALFRLAELGGIFDYP